MFNLLYTSKNLKTEKKHEDQKITAIDNLYNLFLISSLSIIGISFFVANISLMIVLSVLNALGFYFLNQTNISKHQNSQREYISQHKSNQVPDIVEIISPENETVNVVVYLLRKNNIKIDNNFSGDMDQNIAKIQKIIDLYKNLINDYNDFLIQNKFQNLSEIDDKVQEIFSEISNVDHKTLEKSLIIEKFIQQMKNYQRSNLLIEDLKNYRLELDTKKQALEVMEIIESNPYPKEIMLGFLSAVNDVCKNQKIEKTTDISQIINEKLKNYGEDSKLNGQFLKVLKTSNITQTEIDQLSNLLGNKNLSSLKSQSNITNKKYIEKNLQYMKVKNLSELESIAVQIEKVREIYENHFPEANFDDTLNALKTVKKLQIFIEEIQGVFGANRLQVINYLRDLDKKLQKYGNFLGLYRKKEIKELQIITHKMKQLKHVGIDNFPALLAKYIQNNKNKEIIEKFEQKIGTIRNLKKFLSILIENSISIDENGMNQILTYQTIFTLIEPYHNFLYLKKHGNLKDVLNVDLEIEKYILEIEQQSTLENIINNVQIIQKYFGDDLREFFNFISSKNKEKKYHDKIIECLAQNPKILEEINGLLKYTELENIIDYTRQLRQGLEQKNQIESLYTNSGFNFDQIINILYNLHEASQKIGYDNQRDFVDFLKDSSNQQDVLDQINGLLNLIGLKEQNLKNALITLKQKKDIINKKLTEMADTINDFGIALNSETLSYLNKRKIINDTIGSIDVEILFNNIKILKSRNLFYDHAKDFLINHSEKKQKNNYIITNLLEILEILPLKTENIRIVDLLIFNIENIKKTIESFNVIKNVNIVEFTEQFRNLKKLLEDENIDPTQHNILHDFLFNLNNYKINFINQDGYLNQIIFDIKELLNSSNNDFFNQTNHVIYDDFAKFIAATKNIDFNQFIIDKNRQFEEFLILIRKTFIGISNKTMKNFSKKQLKSEDLRELRKIIFQNQINKIKSIVAKNNSNLDETLFFLSKFMDDLFK